MNLYHRYPTKSFGFLPNYYPLETIEDYPILDDFGKEVSGMLANKTFQEEVTLKLPFLDIDTNLSKQKLDRIMMLYSFFASAYMHQDPQNQMDFIPSNIAVPLSKVATALGRPPILAYDSYALYNWKLKDPTADFCVDNLKLLQTFLGGRDEEWFILIHVDIEKKAGMVLDSIAKLNQYTLPGSYSSLSQVERELDTLSKNFKSINDVMDRMPEQCDPAVYYNKVRPYIFGFSNVVYQGVSDKPFSYRGETGAQSSIVPAMVTALGVCHQDTMLTKHLDDMRQYMPVEHQQYLVHLKSVVDDGNGIRSFIGKNPTMSSAYNSCLKELIKFRKTHLHYAVEYIEKKVDNPTGTGGTPYIKWLGKLIEETEEHLL